jgi:hypothetical protein
MNKKKPRSPKERVIRLDVTALSKAANSTLSDLDLSKQQLMTSLEEGWFSEHTYVRGEYNIVESLRQLIETKESIQRTIEEMAKVVQTVQERKGDQEEIEEIDARPVEPDTPKTGYYRSPPFAKRPNEVHVTGLLSLGQLILTRLFGKK